MADDVQQGPEAVPCVISELHQIQLYIDAPLPVSVPRNITVQRIKSFHFTFHDDENVNERRCKPSTRRDTTTRHLHTLYRVAVVKQGRKLCA
jgi:hypothetical protein